MRKGPGQVKKITTYAMKKENKKLKITRKRIDKQAVKNLPGYPLHSTTEDAYSKWKEESEIDPEDITQRKTWQSGRADWSIRPHHGYALPGASCPFIR